VIFDNISDTSSLAWRVDVSPLRRLYRQTGAMKNCVLVLLLLVLRLSVEAQTHGRVLPDSFLHHLHGQVSAPSMTASHLDSAQQICDRSGPADIKACFGAKGDTRYLTGSISRNSNVLNITVGAALIGDPGKAVVVEGCGASGGENLYSTIVAYNSSASLTLRDTCLYPGGVSGAQVEIGTNDTTAIQNCIDAATAATGTASSACLLPPSTYMVTTLAFSSNNQTPITFISHNAILLGIQATSLPCCSGALGLVSIYADKGLSFVGHLTLDGNYDMNYPACMWLDSGFITVHDVDRIHCNIATHIGDPNNSTFPEYPLSPGISEGYIMGGVAYQSNMIFDVFGSNTIYHAVGQIAVIGPGGDIEFGANFCSRHSAWCAVTNRPTIRAIGGWLYVTGGEVINEQQNAVDIEPDSDAGMGNGVYVGSHGVVNIVNAHMEISRLLTITNPNSYKTTDNSPAFLCQGCGGYVASDAPLVTIDSTSHAHIAINNSSFNGTIVRTSHTIVNKSSIASGTFDASSFGKGFKLGLTGLSGANLCLNNDTTVYSATGTALPSSFGCVGQSAFVSDANSPTFLGAYAGNGTIWAPVKWNGSNWITY
jgi:hypothetical protein